MTRSTRFRSAPAASKRRNLVSILIAFAAVSFLYFNFDPTPAGGEVDGEVVNLDQLTEEIDVPTAPNSAGNPSGGKGGSVLMGNSLQGKTALLMNLMLLERGIGRLEKAGTYTATFYKRERVNGRLLDAQVMKLKMRHAPFSVYMKWLVGDKGQELLYVKGQHNGKMLVKLDGVKGRLIPTVRLDPNGATAMKESRHPITEIGLLHLAKTIVEFRQRDIAAKSAPRCRMFDNQVVNDRPCYCFIIEYATREASKDYRKSVIFVDRENFLPICVKNFTWPESESEAAAKTFDKETLIEDYRYSNIHLDQQLADADFDRNNTKYRLRR